MRWKTEQLVNHPNFGKLVRVDKKSLNENRSQSRNPVLELNLGDGSLGAGKAKKRDTRRFLVRVTSFRRRLLDEDNLCEKYHVDCCRYDGLLPSDAPGQAKIETRQEKVKDAADERTEIEILEAE